MTPTDLRLGLVAGEAGDDARGLDAPYGFDGAMEDLMWIGSGHGYRSHQLQSV